MKLKLKLKLLSGALAFGIAAQATAAPADTGGNGDLIFNVANENQSYTRNLALKLDTLQSDIAAGTVNRMFAADATFTSFLASVTDRSSLFWNVVGVDSSGPRRLVTTYSDPLPATRKSNDVIRSAVGEVQQFAVDANTKLLATDSAIFTSAEPGYANRTAPGRVGTFHPDIYTNLNFDTRSVVGAADSFLNGVRINAAATGIAFSTYTPLVAGGQQVQFRLEQDGDLQITAIPEPSTYALLMAGLGMIGFMVRRRLGTGA